MRMRSDAGVVLPANQPHTSRGDPGHLDVMASTEASTYTRLTSLDQGHFRQRVKCRNLTQSRISVDQRSILAAPISQISPLPVLICVRARGLFVLERPSQTPTVVLRPSQRGVCSLPLPCSSSRMFTAVSLGRLALHACVCGVKGCLHACGAVTWMHQYILHTCNSFHLVE